MSVEISQIQEVNCCRIHLNKAFRTPRFIEAEKCVCGGGGGVGGRGMGGGALRQWKEGVVPCVCSWVYLR